ncbi:MAG TPA: M48 family metallopeptidase [Methylomirabilota bacterium]|nr:M48 family metallopeptidase [Methylomirabilota bacterium]
MPLILAALFGLFQYFGANKVTNPETGKTVRVALTSDQEEALGLQSYQEILSQSETLQSGPEVDLVVGVAKKLAAATGDAGGSFNWQVSVIRSDQANAFCLPGGKIAVYTGILPYTQNEAGLAAVMGHEMAHAIARHASQRILRSSLTQTMMMGAALSTGNMDPRDRQMLMGLLGAGAQFGIILPFSRDHETEADQMGLIYMARAGYDPREAIAFWQRMSQSGGNQPPEFASTHPSHGTRVRNLEAFIPRAMQEFGKGAPSVASAGN